jgi:hypothetical protein
LPKAGTSLGLEGLEERAEPVRDPDRRSYPCSETRDDDGNANLGEVAGLIRSSYSPGLTSTKPPTPRDVVAARLRLHFPSSSV